MTILFKPAKNRAHRLVQCGVDGIVIGAVLAAIIRASGEYPNEMLLALALGALSAVPAVVLVLATSRRRAELERDEDERYERYHNVRERKLPAYPFPAPRPNKEK